MGGNSLDGLIDNFRSVGGAVHWVPKMNCLTAGSTLYLLRFSKSDSEVLRRMSRRSAFCRYLFRFSGLDVDRLIVFQR